MTKKTERTGDNKCPSCAAPIMFNPTTGNWKCNYCGGEFSLKDLKNNNSDEKTNANTNYIKYHCQDCGAEIVADEQTSATFCVYCGNTAILKSKLSGDFRPTKIIPFKKEKALAISSFKGLSKGRPLMPKTFNDAKNIEKISGIYIPFWLYDIEVSGDLIADCKNISSWTSGNMNYTKTDIYKASRSGSMRYLKVPVDGSTRFDNDIMSTIEPFNYAELTDYNHAYLSGFLAEKYDVKSDEAFKDANARAVNSTTNVMLTDIGTYTSKVITKNTLSGVKNVAEYVLLPVWMVNVKYNDKYYIFAMNGQTGEFIGNIPIDKKKAILYSLLIFTLSFALVILISYIIYATGN